MAKGPQKARSLGVLALGVLALGVLALGVSHPARGGPSALLARGRPAVVTFLRGLHASS